MSWRLESSRSFRARRPLTVRHFRASSIAHDNRNGPRNRKTAHRQDGVSLPAKAPMREKQAPDGAFFYAPSTREPYKRWAFPMTTIDTSDQRMTGGRIVLRALRDNGVKHIFGYQ